MSNADFLGRAIETVKKAIETDTAGEYEKAYQMYYSAREYESRQKNQTKLTWYS
jgi:vacuolar protein-sorting-associated protein 4